MKFSAAGMSAFLRDVRRELRGVQWPTRQVTVRFTVLIVVVSGVVAFATGALDFLLSALAERFLLR